MNFNIKLPILILLLLLGNSTTYAKVQYLKLGRYETLKASGIKFKTFRKAKPIPLTAISEFKALDKNGKRVDITIYRSEELWLNEQYLGKWGNSFGSVSVAEMVINTPYFPKKRFGKYVSKEIYDKWKNTITHKWGEEEIRKWLELYAGGALKKGKGQELRNPARHIKIRQYDLVSLPSGCVFKAVYYVTNTKRPGSRYAFLYEVNSGYLEKSLKAIVSSIKSISFFKPREVRSKEKRGRKYSSNKNISEEYQASREKVINNIKNMNGWWFLETEHFIICSNLQKRKIINAIETGIEKCRVAYQAYFPEKSEIDEVSVIRVFEERDEYLSYIGKKYKWSIGLWVPNKEELVVSPYASLRGKRARNALLETLYHEGFHQYIFYAADQTEISMWFNEGTAQFFEGVKFAGRGFSIEIPEGELQTFKKYGACINVKSLIAMDHNGFYSDNIDRNYAQAWALMYYLFKGAPSEGKYQYAKIPFRYYDAIIRTKEFREADKIAWEGIDITQFQNDFASFWQSKRKQRKSKRYNPLKDRKLKKVLAE